jgi:hypothetical protein
MNLPLRLGLIWVGVVSFRDVIMFGVLSYYITYFLRFSAGT